MCKKNVMDESLWCFFLCCWIGWGMGVVVVMMCVWCFVGVDYVDCINCVMFGG